MTFGYKDPMNSCICASYQSFACIYCEVDNEVEYDPQDFARDNATRKSWANDPRFQEVLTPTLVGGIKPLEIGAKNEILQFL